MKMSLSVVMGVIDKATAPLKKMSEETNRYSHEINKVEKAQADDSAAMGMIDTYNQLKVAKKQNNLALQAEVEALEKLKQKNKELQKPSAALTAKLEKQKAKVDKLSDSQHGHMKRMSDVRKALTKTGVKVYKLDDEYDRLNLSYKKHGKEINKLQKKYVKLQGWMKVPKGINKNLKMPTVEGVKNGALASAGILGSMAGFGMVINDTASELDALQRAADDIEMPVGELQAMRLQATQAGAEAEDMDAAIKEMALRWGEMKTFKSGAMNDYFEDTGNQKAYDDLMKAKDASEAYQVLLREIAAETDTSKQNFMADEFFGGDSEKMLSLLKGGAEGYEQAKQLLNDTGGPVDPESTKNAQDFSAALGKMSAIIDSLKISALTPIMAELSFVMEDLALNMKDMDWREGKIAELREIVKSTFNAFRTLGSGVLWLSENMATVIGVLAGVKLALIGINAVALANPLGPFIIAIGAIIAGVGFLIDRFGGLTAVIDKVKSVWNGLWGDNDDAEKINEVTNATQALESKSVEIGVTTNELKSSKEKINTEKYYSAVYENDEPPTHQPYNPYMIETQISGADKVKAQAQLMKEAQSRNVELGLTTNKVTNQVTNNELFERTTSEQSDTINSLTREQLEQTQTTDYQVTGADKVKAQAQLMKEMKNQNVELGLTTSEVTNSFTNTELFERATSEQSDTTNSLTREQLEQKQTTDYQITGADKVKAQAKLMKEMKNRNVELGITTNETVNQSVNQPELDTWDTSTDYIPTGSGQNHEPSLKQQERNNKYQPLGQSSLSGGYKPLTAQTVNSKSEIDLRIKSDKPVTVEKANVDKGTDINLDVGDMSWSY